MPLRSALWSQFGWGFCFAAVNPGFVVVFTLGAWFVQRDLSMWLALPVWLVLLTLCNIVYARIRRRTWVLDLTPEGNFALHRGNPRWASNLGRTQELRVRLDSDPDPAFLHEVELADVEIEKLTARDVRELGATLAQHGATR